MHKRESTYTQAVREGALAFFGDTYGEKVRVVEMGNGSTGPTTTGRPFSMEVCGGTHLERTGDIGLCLVISEQSIGSGMRRIEAVTGRAAEQLAREHLDTLGNLGHLLGATTAEVPARVAGVLEEVERERQRAASLERRLLRTTVEAALSGAKEAGGVRLFALRLDDATSPESLRETADWVRAKLGSAVIALGAVIGEQPVIFVAVTPDLVAKGLHAGNLARELGKVMEGGGGGRPESGQAGGKRKDKLDVALHQLPPLVGRRSGKP
ncbi:MAG: hypothetical protein HYY31_03100 [Chloroflexi bacterium]|nr:hypothetical protein [Chloroflexota bacterium]